MSEWDSEVRRRLAGLALGPEREMEIVEELSLHLDARAEELRRSGASPAGARAAVTGGRVRVVAGGEVGGVPAGLAVQLAAQLMAGP